MMDVAGGVADLVAPALGGVLYSQGLNSVFAFDLVTWLLATVALYIALPVAEETDEEEEEEPTEGAPV